MSTQDEISAAVALAKLITFYRNEMGLSVDDPIVQNLMLAHNSVVDLLTVEGEEALAEARQRAAVGVTVASFSEALYDFLGQFFEDEESYHHRMAVKQLSEMVEEAKRAGVDSVLLSKFGTLLKRHSSSIA